MQSLGLCMRYRNSSKPFLKRALIWSKAGFLKELPSEANNTNPLSSHSFFSFRSHLSKLKELALSEEPSLAENSTIVIVHLCDSETITTVCEVIEWRRRD